MFVKIVLSLIILFTSYSSVSARETGQIQEKVQNRIVTATKRPEISNTNKEQVREKISAVRRERIRSYFGHMVTRFEAIIERLEKIITRLETRIKKIESGNEEIKTDSVKNDIKQAKEMVSSVKIELQKTKTLNEEMLASDDPKISFEKVRESTKNIKENLTEIHKLLVHAIGELKGLRVGQSK